MRVVVTGAGSMLMRRVVEMVAARGDEIRCVQRRAVTVPDGVEVMSADVRDADAMVRAVSGCDAVIHGAARVGVMGTWDEFRTVNVEGTGTVLEAARRAGVPRLVYVSTPSVAHVGRSLVGEGAQPARTGRRGRALYAESKALAEQVALAGDGDDMGVVAVRPHLVWGPGDTQLVGRIVAAAQRGRLPLIGGGRALIDTTYVDNAAEALVAALDVVAPRSSVAGRAYLVANGEPRPLRDLLLGICAAAGVQPRVVPVPAAVARAAGSVVERVWPRFSDEEPPLTRFVAEQMATAHWFDLSETFRDLAWRPTVTIDEGLRRLEASSGR
jgi:nucleoside-diphosphate-sugar epimerase